MVMLCDAELEIVKEQWNVAAFILGISQLEEVVYDEGYVGDAEETPMFVMLVAWDV